MLFQNAFVHTMEEDPIREGFVLVRDGKIAALGPMDALPDFPGEETLDLQGKLLLPGFVDAHSHIGMMGDGLGFEGDDINEDSDPCTPQLRAIDAVNPFDRCFAEAREWGVTSVVVTPGSTNPLAGQIYALKTHGRWVEEMLVEPGPLGMKFAFGENPKMTYSEKSQAPISRMATAALIREQLQKAKRYLEDKEKAVEEEGDPPEYDAKCEALAPLLKGEIKAHIHAHKAYDILTGVGIAREFGFPYTLVHCTEGYLIADILAEQGASAICGPMICARTKPELAGLSLENCAKLMEAGLTVAISTDHPEIPVNFLSLSAEIAAANGVDRERALRAITVDAAEAAGLSHRVGSIAPGKDADLLVFSRDPLQGMIKPEQVYIGGTLVAGSEIG